MRAGGTRPQRANALPETALVVSLSLLLLFGAVQEAIFGFDQVAADGASFMGAQKSVQLKGGGATLSDAQTVVGMLFPRFKSSTVTVATSSSGQPLFETDVSEQISTIGLPGVQMPSKITIQSRDVEASAPSTPASPGVPQLCYSLASGNGIGSTPTFNLPLKSVLNSSSGVVSLSVLSSHSATLGTLGTSFTNLPTNVSNVATDLYNIVNLPIIGSTLQVALGLANGALGTVQTYIAGQIQTTLNASLAGTATNSQLSGLLGVPIEIVQHTLGLLGHSQLTQLLTDNSVLETTLTNINTSEASLNTISGTSSSC